MLTYSSVRYYGGHYDSIKQAFIRNSLNQPDSPPSFFHFINRYVARLRLDMMFAGNTVITDAQFFDGPLFHAIVSQPALRNDFFHFLALMGNLHAPLFEIRLRPGGLIHFLSKPVIFSTLNTEYEKNSIYTAMQLGRKKAKKPYNTLSSVHDSIIGNLMDSTLEPSVERLFGGLKILNQAPSCVFIEWSKNISFKRAVSRAKEEIRFKVTMTGAEELDSTLTNIALEMQKPLPNRSYIYDLIHKARSSYEAYPTYVALLNDIWIQVCQIFNLAFAFQHNCYQVDRGEAESRLLVNTSIDECLSPGLIAAIAEEPWVEFYKRLSKDPIKTHWSNWRLSFGNQVGKGKSAVRLETYVKAVQREYGQNFKCRAFEIIGGGSIEAKLAPSAFSFKIPFEDIISLPFAIPKVVRALKHSKRDRANLIQYYSRSVCNHGGR